jgi:transcriptional regulator of acetoin/glycerol metabolism
MPALRERLEDVGAIARALLGRMGAGAELDQDAVAAMTRHVWPGNVREMRNVLERACALAQGPRIGLEDLRFDGVDARLLVDEEHAILDLVARHDGNVAAAARALGVRRTTLRDRVYRARGL